MPDRKKVIKGLEYCFATANCDGCPYEIERRKIPFKTPENHCPILDDVLALLKEQEAKKPVVRKKNGYLDHVCPTCGSRDEELFREWNYCPFCGQEVKWE